MDGDTPEPGQSITELYAWVATHANGGEGIVAAVLPGLGATPLISSKRAVMAMAEGVARHAVALSAGRAAGRAISVDLVTFKRVPS